MPKLIIDIDMDNDAFCYGEAIEVNRMLQAYLKLAVNDGTCKPTTLIDLNGNRVGQVIVEK